MADYMCNWLNVEDDWWQTGCQHMALAEPDDFDFVYCPYCGHKIMVVEDSDE